MEKRTRNIMLGSSIAAVGLGVVGAVHAATTHYLVDVALNRNAPKYTQKAGRRLSGVEIDEVWLRKRMECGQQLDEGRKLPHELPVRPGFGVR